jgi:hypothetical protein
VRALALHQCVAMTTGPRLDERQFDTIVKSLM